MKTIICFFLCLLFYACSGDPEAKSLRFTFQGYPVFVSEAIRDAYVIENKVYFELRKSDARRLGDFAESEEAAGLSFQVYLGDSLVAADVVFSTTKSTGEEYSWKTVAFDLRNDTKEVLRRSGF